MARGTQLAESLNGTGGSAPALGADDTLDGANADDGNFAIDWNAFGDGFGGANLYWLYAGRAGGGTAGDPGDPHGDGKGPHHPGNPNTTRVGVEELGATEGVQIFGATPAGRFGDALCLADVNGDGYDDLVIGDWGADRNGAFSGSIYVIFGSAEGVPTGPDVVLDGTNGFRIDGIADNDRAGRSISAGDVNGDGRADLIIGAQLADAHGENSGSAYVVYRADEFKPTLQLSQLHGRSGVALSGSSAHDELHNVGTAGDANGDGYDDLIVGAGGADANGANSGSAYLIFGTATGIPRDLDLAALDGVDGVKINGETADDYAGWAVSSGADVNGDGFSDLLIGARFAGGSRYGGEGAAYVVFGSASGFGASIDLGALDGANGFKVSGTPSRNFLGYSVNAADFNGDGYSDIVVGAKSFYDNPASYVVYGAAGAFAAELSVDELDGNNGSSVAGGWVAGAGDVNGDGYDDLLVGASYSCSVSLLFGSSDGFGSGIDPASPEGFNGIRLVGADEDGRVVGCVTAAGDLNADGYDDICIGTTDPHGPGAVYVIYGRDFTAADAGTAELLIF